MSKIYPKMTVEKRESSTAHKLKAPLEEGSEEYNKELQDTIVLCREANRPESWTQDTIDILLKYSPVGSPSIDTKTLLSEFGFNSWKEICDFVRDDECIEFMVKVAKWAKFKGFNLKKDRGFIDGTGIGIYDRYLNRLKSSLEQTFDAKYFYKAERPLEYLHKITGVDFSYMADYVHPGHNRYPAGHGVKFYEAVDNAVDTYKIESGDRINLIYAAYVVAMGRSGILVHLPEDNIASGFLADLPEFSNWKEKKKK